MSGSQVADLVGRRLGERYRLESLLGHGGMAVVYRAVDEALGRQVAIKVFSASTTDADDLRRQDGEVRMLASLSHPGLVTLFDAGAEDSERGPLAYIVMELVEGETLQDRMSTGPLPGPDVAAIGADLADALHYIHRRDVVHRDIKPANVLLASNHAEDTQSAIKLADFGIARIIDGTRLTATGSIIGTVSYLSPEQAMGSAVDSAADIYALGLVLLECLTGAKVFPGSAAESVSARVLRDPDIPASLPDAWRTLLRSMTSRVPTDRPSARDASLELRRIARDGAATVEPAPTVIPAGASTTDARTSAMTPLEHPTQALDATELAAVHATDAGVRALAAVDQPTRRLDVPESTRPLPTAATERIAAAPDIAASGVAAPAITEPAASPTESTRSPRRRHSGLAVGVAAILLVLAALIGWSVLQGMETSAGTSPVDYPNVPGDLGTSLEELQRTVEDPE